MCEVSSSQVHAGAVHHINYEHVELTSDETWQTYFCGMFGLKSEKFTSLK